MLHRDTGKPFRPELRLEGEEGDEDSLGAQRELPVVGTDPLSRPAAENRVGHGTGLGTSRRITPVRSKCQH